MKIVAFPEVEFFKAEVITDHELKLNLINGWCDYSHIQHTLSIFLFLFALPQLLPEQNCYFGQIIIKEAINSYNSYNQMYRLNKNKDGVKIPEKLLLSNRNRKTM